MGIMEIMGLGKEVESIGSGVSKPIKAMTDGLDKLFTSDEERLSKQEILDRVAQRPMELQATLDMAYAASKNAFAACARPFNVYVAGINILSINVALWFDKAIPQWFSDASLYAFLGALGLYGTHRTIEKLNSKH